MDAYISIQFFFIYKAPVTIKSIIGTLNPGPHPKQLTAARKKLSFYQEGTLSSYGGTLLLMRTDR